MLESDSAILNNLRVVDGFLESFNRHDLDEFIELLAESAVYYQPGIGEPLRGREAIREEFARVLFTSFPDIKLEKVRSFGQDEWVSLEFVLYGTHTGPIPSPAGGEIPATGKSIRVPMCLVARIYDGKITELHDYHDQLGFLAQLGLQ
ncbi:MAG: ester cyclase [Promethearchaeota archaeon]|jgi:steroid delta-isomerase-like uncharacterized protein